MNNKNLIVLGIILISIFYSYSGYSQHISWEQNEKLKNNVYKLIQDFCKGSEDIVKGQETQLSKLFVNPNDLTIHHFLSFDSYSNRINVKDYEEFIKTNYPQGLLYLDNLYKPEILLHIDQSDSTLIEAKLILEINYILNQDIISKNDTIFFIIQYKISKGELKDFKIREINDLPVLFENSLKPTSDEKAFKNSTGLMNNYSKFGVLSNEDQIQPSYIDAFEELFYKPNDSTQVVNYLDFEKTTPDHITLPEYIHFITDWYIYKTSNLSITNISEVFPLVECSKNEYVGQIKANVKFSGLYKSKFIYQADQLLYFLLHFDKRLNPQIIAIATDAFYLNSSKDIIQKQKGEFVLDLLATPAATGFFSKGSENYVASFDNFNSQLQFGGKTGIELTYYFRSKKTDSAKIAHRWGIGLGGYYTIINGLISCDNYSDHFSQLGDSTIIDKDGDPFTKDVYGNNIKHEINLTNIEIPLLFKYRHKRPKINYYVNLGISFSYNIKKDYASNNGSYEYQGSYDLIRDGVRYIFTLSDLPEYGYYHYQAQSTEEIIIEEMNFSIIGAAGAEIPISKSFSFRFGPSVIYNITNLLNDSELPEKLTIQNGINESLLYKNKIANYYLFGFDLGFTIEL